MNAKGILMMPNEIELIDTSKLSKQLGFSKLTIRRMVADGRLPQPLSLGRTKRWRLSDINQWVADGCPNTQEHVSCERSHEVCR